MGQCCDGDFTGLNVVWGATGAPCVRAPLRIGHLLSPPQARSPKPEVDRRSHLSEGANGRHSLRFVLVKNRLLQREVARERLAGR